MIVLGFFFRAFVSFAKEILDFAKWTKTRVSHDNDQYCFVTLPRTFTDYLGRFP